MKKMLPRSIFLALLVLTLINGIRSAPAYASEDTGSDAPDENSYVSVTIGGTTKYYNDYMNAWESAQGQVADITFLRNLVLDKNTSLSVSSGDITIHMSDNVVLIGDNSQGTQSIICATGGNLSIESGSIENQAAASKVIYANGGNVIIENAALTAMNGSSHAVYVDNGGNAEIKGGTLTATDQTYTGSCVYVTGNGSSATISGGTLRATHGVTAANDSTITISGGEINGATRAAWIENSTAVINGGKLTKISTGDETLYATNSDITMEKDASIIANRGNSASIIEGSQLKMTDGTLQGCLKLDNSSADISNGIVTVTDTSSTTAIAMYHESRLKVSGTANITGQLAGISANDSSTLEVIGGSVSAVTNNTTQASAGISVFGNANVTISDGQISGSATTSGYTESMGIRTNGSGGSVTINGGSVTGHVTSRYGTGYAYGIYANSGTFEINGGTITGKNTGTAYSYSFGIRVEDNTSTDTATHTTVHMYGGQIIGESPDSVHSYGLSFVKGNVELWKGSITGAEATIKDSSSKPATPAASFLGTNRVYRNQDNIITDSDATDTALPGGTVDIVIPVYLSGISWNAEDSYIYNKNPQGPVLSTPLPEEIAVTKTGEQAVNAGEYEACAEFTLADGYADDTYILIGTNPLVQKWTIKKAAAPNVNPETRSYIPVIGSNGKVSIDISGKLPEDKGTTTYSFKTSDSDNILSDVSVDENGILSYTVKGDKPAGTSASVTINAIMQNYEDASVTLNVNIIEKKQAVLQEGSTVTIKEGASLIYGQKLSDLEFAGVVFVEEDSDIVVTGTLSWKTPDDMPEAGTEIAEWIFNPDIDGYEPIEGTAAISVVKATPYISETPKASGITQGDTLAVSVLAGGRAEYGNGSGQAGSGTTQVIAGTFTWKNTSAKPTVSDSNYTAYTVTFTPEDTKNYNTVEFTITVSVKEPEKPVQKPEPTPAPTISKEEKAQNTSRLTHTTKSTWSGKKLVVQWGNIKNATHYEVYIAACGESYGKAQTTVKAKTDSTQKLTLKKVGKKAINPSKTYKYKVKAYRIVNGKKQYLATSRTMHVAGEKHKKYTNAASIKLKKSSYKLKKNKTASIKASIVKADKKKKLLSSGHGPALTYESSDKKVATVTKKGVIKAKKKGTCYIYVQALNGIQKKVKVTVR